MSNLLKYKGIHPGIVLNRLLKKRDLKQRTLAMAIDEHPQTLNAITKAKRNLNTSLALKIEKELNLEEGALAVLQTYYEIRREKEKQKNEKPKLSLLRASLFWDTDIDKIDWDKHYKAVINRVFERGNETEKKEIKRFYGKQKVNDALVSTSTKPFSLAKQ